MDSLDFISCCIGHGHVLDEQDHMALPGNYPQSLSGWLVGSDVQPVVGGMESRTSFQLEGDFEVADVAAKGLMIPKSTSEFSQETLQQLRKLQEVLQERNNYFIRGPFIEAIQLYIEELRLECQKDIESSERYLPEEICAQFPKKGFRPCDEIFLSIKALRCRVSVYMNGGSFQEIRKNGQNDTAFHNSLIMLRAMIRGQPPAKSASMKKFIGDRIAKFTKLMEVLQLVDDLRSTKAGMDILSQELDCDVGLENLEQLIAVVEGWFAVLEQDLKPGFTLKVIGDNSDEGAKKTARRFCMDLQEGIQTWKVQFLGWKDRAGSRRDLEAIALGFHGYIHSSFEQLTPEHPCHSAFQGHMAIKNSAARLSQTLAKMMNVMRFHQGACWLAEEGFSDMDNALEGMLCLSELLALLTALPAYKAGAKEPDLHSGLRIVSQVIIEHWHENVQVIKARESIRRMQEQHIVPTSSDVMKFKTALRNPVVPLAENKGIMAVLLAGNSNPVKRDEVLDGFEDPAGAHFDFVDSLLVLFLKQAVEQVNAVIAALDSDPTFSLKQARDYLSPPSAKLKEEEKGKKLSKASKKSFRKAPQKNERSPTSPQLLMEPIPSKAQEGPSLMAGERAINEVEGEEGQKFETPEESPLPVIKDVATGFEAVDMSSFRQCIESVSSLQPVKESSSVCDKKVKSIDRVMSYCDRNKYSSRTRKERNVIDILKANQYYRLPQTGGSHQRWKHPLLPDHDPITLSTKSGGDLVHCRTIKAIEEQLRFLKQIDKGESISSSASDVFRNGLGKSQSSRQRL